MFLRSHHINKGSFISDIVKNDHRTAEVFRKYDIDFCCGGKWPLDQICLAKGLDCEKLLEELYLATCRVEVPPTLQYSSWSINFLIEYIIRVHHDHLRIVLPNIKTQLAEFIVKHAAKYPQLAELGKVFKQLEEETVPHLQEEEEVIFPYIRQLAAATKDKATYGKLFVRTLRKPLESFFHNEHLSMGKLLQKMRGLTDNYIAPSNACIRHRVVYALLRDLDNDLAQHIYLENEILFPRAIVLEKGLQ